MNTIASSKFHLNTNVKMSILNAAEPIQGFLELLLQHLVLLVNLKSEASCETRKATRSGNIKYLREL